MTTIIGKLKMNEEGQLCITMNENASNPLLNDIPLNEIFEEYVGKKVKLDIMPFGILAKKEESE